MSVNPLSPAKIRCALQLRGPGQAPHCLSLFLFSLDYSLLIFILLGCVHGMFSAENFAKERWNVFVEI
jgi:hypothetical protein